MANSLGQLLVKLGLDSAEFTSGLTKSQYQAQKFADSMSNKVAVGIIKAEVAMQAFVKTAQFAIHAIPDLVRQAGDFQDLGEKVGDNAANFASLAVSAKVADTEMSFVADTSIKLQKNLAKIDDTSTGAGRAIKALGLDLKTFKDLSPTDQMEALAKALKGFDEAGKPVVLEALVKGGAQLLPFLKELGEGVGRVNILTEAQIKLADEWSDKQKRSRAELNLHAQALATEFLPAITAVQDAVIGTIKEMLGLDQAGKDLKNGTAVAEWSLNALESFATVAEGIEDLTRLFKSAGVTIGGSAAEIMQLLQFNPRGLKEVQAAEDEALDAINGASRFSARLRAQIAKQRFGFDDREPGGSSAPPKKKISTAGLVDGVADTARAVLKKELEGNLKLIKDFAEQQKSGFEFANQYVKGAYDDGITSLSDFFAKQKALRDAGLQAELDALDKTIAAQKAYKNNPLLKPEERVDAELKIKDAVEKRALAIQKASQSNILNTQEEARAFKQLAYNYYDFLATVKESQGDTVGSAALNIARARQANQELLTKVGFDPQEAAKQADALAERLLTQSKLNRAQADYSLLTESAGVKEKAALLDAQLSGASEIETLTKIANIRQDALGSLGQLVVKARELADALGTPEAKLFADKLALQFKQAAAEAEPLLLKVRDLGKEMGDSIASSFEDAVLHGKSLRDVLQGIGADLLQIVIRSQFTKPLGEFLGNALGGNGTSSGGGGILGGIFGFLSGGGGGGSPGAGFSSDADLLSFVTGMRAAGGPVDAGGMYRVNERGPELLDVNGRQFLMMGNQRGTVIPNDRLGGMGGDTYHIAISVPYGTPRDTASQMAAELQRKLSAGGRNR